MRRIGFQPARHSDGFINSHACKLHQARADVPIPRRGQIDGTTGKLLRLTPRKSPASTRLGQPTPGTLSGNQRVPTQRQRVPERRDQPYAGHDNFVVVPMFRWHESVTRSGKQSNGLSYCRADDLHTANSVRPVIPAVMTISSHIRFSENVLVVAGADVPVSGGNVTGVCAVAAACRATITTQSNDHRFQ